MLDGSKGPLVGVQFEILQDPNRLPTLPLNKVEQRLAFARIRVLPVDPRAYFLWQDLVHAKRTTGPLLVEAFRASMIEVRIVHCSLFSQLQALPIMFRNRN
jgi:hypothetical protein